ncbi:MAG: sulfite exporter TauE/SafE family protein [Kineosporiaceae bacterium]|nr:sulfite exporter TauE/SafE family protein [Kineosporiaceae bacterium]
MDPFAAVTIALAGVAAGTINTVVGSGTLITFPTLLSLGYPPVTANVSNNIGLIFGAVSGTWGYRRELAGQRRLVTRLAPLSASGAACGALALLWLPPTAFEAIVPVLIALALVLVLLQPRISAAMTRRRTTPGPTPGTGPGPGQSSTPGGIPAGRTGVVLGIGTAVAGVYGGYFGAAQGVLLIGLLGSALPETLQRVNGLKNLLSALVNTVAAVTFLVVRPEAADWTVIALIAVGSLVGGVLGARIGRWLPQPVLRAVIIVVGVVAIVRLVNGG